MIITVFKRFLRTFVATLTATVAAQIAGGITIASIEDLKKFGISLVVSVIAASIVALDKTVRLLNADEGTQES